MTRSEREGKAFTWVGKIEGQPLGDVVLSVYDGSLSGSVVLPRGAYRIRQDGARYVVEELDSDAFPDDNCFPREPPRPTPGRRRTLPPRPTTARSSTCWSRTRPPRVPRRGIPAMLSQVNLAIAETNTGYQNSGVVQRLRLAGAVEVAYTESGNNGVDLDRVTCLQGQWCNGQIADPDGYLDEVHALRDTY